MARRWDIPNIWNPIRLVCIRGWYDYMGKFSSGGKIAGFPVMMQSLWMQLPRPTLYWAGRWLWAMFHCMVRHQARPSYKENLENDVMFRDDRRRCGSCAKHMSGGRPIRLAKSWRKLCHQNECPHVQSPPKIPLVIKENGSHNIFIYLLNLLCKMTCCDKLR